MKKILFALALVASVATSGWATMVDLSNTSITSGTIKGAIFEYYKYNPSGTGVFDPFVRIQADGNEQGYNTTQPNQSLMPFDEGHGWTFDLPFSSLQASGGYYEFALDIGEPVAGPTGSESLLSLDGVKIYSATTGGQNTTSINALGTLLWDMDVGVGEGEQDNWVKLDANREGNPGNGWSDMLLSIPESVFSTVGPNDYIILWSRFGLQEASDSGTQSFGTFEEWGTINAGTPVPEPATLLLLGSGLVGLWGFRRKFKK